ncbi:glutathione synthase [Podila verticillata]|nr:glutathione synthase [Podila verticillata]
MTAQSQHRITHCIFDMDGLLINTETLYTEISSEILARYGKTYGFELKSKLMGLREKESAEILVRETGADMTPEEYLHERHLLQLERFPHCVPLPGVMRLIKHLKAHKIPIAVATSSYRKNFNLKATNNQHLFTLFDVIVCGDDPAIKNGKPNPDIFFVARDRLAEHFEQKEVDNSNCLVFEDSPIGVQAGVNASMKVLWVPDENISRLYPNLEGPTLRIDSLEEFDPMADDVYVLGTDEQVDEGIIQFLREEDPDWSGWDEYDGQVGEDEEDDDEQPQLQPQQAPPRARQQVPQLPPLPPAQPQPPPQAQATQDPEERDPDFMSQSNVVVRARAGTAISSMPEPRPKNVETEWIASQTGQNGKPKCPECNRPAKRSDIRRLWSKAVVTLDTSEKDEAVAKLRKEQEARIRSETDLANSRMAYEMLKIQMTNLQKKHDRQRSLKLKYGMITFLDMELLDVLFKVLTFRALFLNDLRYKSEAKRLKLSNTDEDIKKFNYSLIRMIPIPGVYQPTNASQYLSYRPNEEMLICSRHVRDSFGISKISMRDFSNNLAGIIPIHSKPIRDVQCYRVDPFANESLVLTASMDNYLKITSAKSQQVVLGYIMI